MSRIIFLIWSLPDLTSLSKPICCGPFLRFFLRDLSPIVLPKSEAIIGAARSAVPPVASVGIAIAAPTSAGITAKPLKTDASIESCLAW